MSQKSQGFPQNPKNSMQNVQDTPATLFKKRAGTGALL